MKLGHFAYYNLEKLNFTVIKEEKKKVKKKVTFCFGIEYGAITDSVCRQIMADKICFFCFFGAFAVNIAMNIMLKYFTFLSENGENNTKNHKKRYF